MQVIILLGRSGAGKGTQGELLRGKFGLEYLGSGDLLRARAQVADYSGGAIKTVLTHGGFSPTALIFKLWMDKLEEFKSRQNFAGFLFDGSPRKIMEAHLIDEAMGWYGWKDAMKIFLLNVPKKVALDRLMKRRICNACGFITSLDFVSQDKNIICKICDSELTRRSDDTPEAINSRLELFEKEVMPVIEYYQKGNRLAIIDGAQGVREVAEEIFQNLTNERVI